MKTIALVGYKETKLGIIPDDWKVVKLRDIATKCTKKNTDEAIKTVFSNSAINGLVLQSEYFDKDIAQQGNLDGYYIVQEGDFVYNPRISQTAPAGPINRNLNNQTGVVSPLYTVFKIKSDEEIKFLEHFFKSTKWLKYMMSVANYGARHDRMNVTSEDLFDMPIPFPKKEEREKIAHILTTWDEAIIKQEELIKEKEQFKKGLMQKLLSGEVRFDGFTDEWNDANLESIGNFYLGLTYTPEYVNEGVPFLSVKDIRGNLISFENTKFISHEEFKNSTENAKPKKGDILFGRVGTLGNPIVIETDLAFCIFVSLGYIRVKNNINNKFIMHWMNSDFFEKQVETQVAGSSQKNLNVGWLKKFKILLPSKIEQEKIAEFFDCVDSELMLLKNKLKELKQQKKGLMQKLLTGEVRVKI
jgi:type I restriction enzyme S subunit